LNRVVLNATEIPQDITVQMFKWGRHNHLEYIMRRCGSASDVQPAVDPSHCPGRVPDHWQKNALRGAIQAYSPSLGHVYLGFEAR